MARIAGVEIPRNKKIGIAITYIFGIGRANGLDILKKANVNPDIRVRDLTEEEVGRIREILDREYRIEGNLRREIQLNIKRLMDIGSYLGLRHPQGSARARAAHAYQRAHPPRTPRAGDRYQEEDSQEVTFERSTFRRVTFLRRSNGKTA